MSDKLAKGKDDGRVRWFGESWGAPVCEPEDRIGPPVGRPCMRCGQAIAAGDQGLMVVHLGEAKDWRGALRCPWHLGCWLESVLPQKAAVEEEPHGWTHPICEGCWYKRNPDRFPVRFLPEVCCFCGERTGSGIFVREKAEKCGFCPDNGGKSE